MPNVDLLEQEELEEVKASDTAEFDCPNCGKIHQDDVVFLCNNCDSKELIYKEGLYVCPQCLTEKKDNFECMLCGSKEVSLSFKNKKK